MIDEFGDEPQENESVVWAPQSGAQEMLINCPITLVGFGGARGGGKGLALDELIPTTNGWKTMASVKIGDSLFNANGQPVNVIYKSEPQLRQCYRITFDNGQTIIADDIHRWRTYTKAERVSNFRLSDDFRAKRRALRPSRAKKESSRPKTTAILNLRNRTRTYIYKEPNNGAIRDTNEIYNTLRVQDGREVNHAIKLAGAAQYPQKKLSIPPYILGLWLGDGSQQNGLITVGDLDIEEMAEIINEEGYRLTKQKDDIVYKIVRDKPFVTELKELNLIHNKHIPSQYLLSSVEQRLALLQGLLDTDGCCNKDGQIEFCNTNKNIAEGVYELLASLGAKPFMTSKDPLCSNAKGGAKRCKTAWIVKATTTLPVFKLKRKLERLPQKTRETQKWHYIVHVEPVESVWTQCLTVDCPTHQFLVSKSYIPTHNTDGVLGKFAIDQDRMGEHFNAIFFRKELPQADDLIERAKQIYMPLGAHWQDQKKQFTFKRGGRLRFRPLANDADAEKFQGQSLSAAAIEEAGNYSDPSPIWKLFGALRGKGGGQIILTFNPGGSGHHWLKEMFIKPWPQGKKILYKELPNGKKFDYIYLPSRVYDNQILLSKDPGYIDRLHMVGSPELVRAWLEGDFEIHEGSYFPEFSSKHIITPFNIPKHWPRYLGYDWGYRSPFAAVWGAVSSGKDDKGKEVPYPRGAIIIYREVWGKGVDNVAQADKIASLSVGENPIAVADPSIFSHEGGPSINDQFSNVFAKYKHPNFRSADNDRISGWSQIRQRLIAKPPLLYIFASCPYLIETLPALTIDKRKAEDADSSGNDHACFVGNTKILTDTGAVTIEALAELSSFNVLTHTGQFTRAVAGLTQKAAKVIKLKFDDGSEVVCTPDHKFHNGSDWEKAVDLSEIKTNDGKTKKISGIEKLESPQDVFCLFVPETNTFVLDNGAVVHNCDALRYLCKERLIESPWEPPKQVYNKGRVQLQAYVEMVRRQTRRARI